MKRNNFYVCEEQLLPSEILLHIFRSNKDVFYLSRMVCKTIRHDCFPYFLQYELLLPIREIEYKNLTTYALLEFENEKVNTFYGHQNSIKKYVVPCSENNNQKILCSLELISRGQLVIVTMHFMKKISREQKIIDKYDMTTDIDFVSFYNLMLKRLSNFTCNKTEIAYRLTMQKHEQIKQIDIDYALFLWATALTLNLPLPLPPFYNKEIINYLEPLINKHLLKLQ